MLQIEELKQELLAQQPKIEYLKEAQIGRASCRERV